MEEFRQIFPTSTNPIEQEKQQDKFFMVLTLTGLQPNLDGVPNQILSSPNIPKVDDLLLRLLHLSPTTSSSTSPTMNDTFASVSQSSDKGQGGRGNQGGCGSSCFHCRPRQ